MLFLSVRAIAGMSFLLFNGHISQNTPCIIPVCEEKNNTSAAPEVTNRQTFHGHLRYPHHHGWVLHGTLGWRSATPEALKKYHVFPVVN
jgi:hypothetical protein